MTNGGELTAATDEARFSMAKVGRHGVVYTVGSVLSKSVAFLMLPLYTRYLTPSDYGVLQLIKMTVEIISIMAGSRIAVGIFHFYYKADSAPERRRVLSTALLLLSATYGLAACATFALAPWIAHVIFGSGGAYVLYLQLTAADFFVTGLSVVPIAHIQVKEKSWLFVGVNTARLLLQLVLNVIFLIPLHMGLEGLFIANLLADVVIAVWVVTHLVNAVGIGYGGAAARAFLRFGIPLVGMQMATFVTTFGDRYFLNRAADTAAVGLYGLGYQFGFLLATLGYAPFQRVWNPTRFAVAKRPDRNAIYSRGFVYLNVVLITVAVLLSLYVKDALRVMATPPFYAAAGFVPVIVAAYVMQSWGGFHNLGILITERTEYYAAGNIVAAIVALVGYVTLIPRYLGWGAAIATLAAFVARFIVLYAFSQRLWPVAYRWRPVIRLALVGVGVAEVGWLLPNVTLVASIALHTIAFGVYLAILWHLGIFSDRERERLWRILKSPRRALAGLVTG